MWRMCPKEKHWEEILCWTQHMFIKGTCIWAWVAQQRLLIWLLGSRLSWSFYGCPRSVASPVETCFWSTSSVWVGYSAQQKLPILRAASHLYQAGFLACEAGRDSWLDEVTDNMNVLQRCLNTAFAWGAKCWVILPVLQWHMAAPVSTVPAAVQTCRKDAVPALTISREFSLFRCPTQSCRPEIQLFQISSQTPFRQAPT